MDSENDFDFRETDGFRYLEDRFKKIEEIRNKNLKRQWQNGFLCGVASSVTGFTAGLYVKFFLF